VIKNQYNIRVNPKVLGAFLALLVCTVTVPFAELQALPVIPAAVGLQSNSKTAREIEYEVKAAFIFNFMKFIEWPPEKQRSKENDAEAAKSMIIGIVGTNPFGSAFQPILDKEVQKKKIRLVEIPGFQSFQNDYRNQSQALDDYKARYQPIISECDVLFICESENDYRKELLSLTEGRHLLTISDLPEFAKKDGMIGFVKDNNKIRFEINLQAAEKEKMKIRSQLLTLAKEVYEVKK
jgi:hypothetical protein